MTPILMEAILFLQVNKRFLVDGDVLQAYRTLKGDANDNQVVLDEDEALSGRTGPVQWGIDTFVVYLSICQAD